MTLLLTGIPCPRWLRRDLTSLVVCGMHLIHCPYSQCSLVRREMLHAGLSWHLLLYGPLLSMCFERRVFIFAVSAFLIL